MFQYHCLNPIAAVGLKFFDENYVKTENAMSLMRFLSEVQKCTTWNSEEPECNRTCRSRCQ